MSFLERLGYVRKGIYEEVVSERDYLMRIVSELEDNIRALEEDKNKLEKRVEFLAMAVPAVIKIKNIGQKTAQRLGERGIKNVVDLIEASPEKIAEAIGVPRERALELIKKGTKLITKKRRTS